MLGWLAEDERLIPAHAGKTQEVSRAGVHSRAHPRSRGENERIPAAGAGWDGSSPLTRGKHYRVDSGEHVRGLIPAHAGKTADSPVVLEELGAQPRSRGENTI